LQNKGKYNNLRDKSASKMSPELALLHGKEGTPDFASNFQLCYLKYICDPILEKVVKGELSKCHLNA